MRRPLAMIVTVALTLALSLPGGVQSARLRMKESALTSP